MNAIQQWLLLFWMVFVIGFTMIGGYFMFRKFIKGLPKQDGKSILDWQQYYIEKSLPLWTEEGKQLLNDLVSPVPQLFRDTAKQTIAGKIGELALKENVQQIDADLIIRGYILATPKRDHKFLVKYLKEKNIDFSKYQTLLEQ